MKLPADEAKPFPRVWYALLRANLYGQAAPPGYETLRGRLWASCYARRTAPKAVEFATRIDELLEVLRLFSAPNGIIRDGSEQCLEAAKWLKRARERGFDELPM